MTIISQTFAAPPPPPFPPGRIIHYGWFSVGETKESLAATREWEIRMDEYKRIVAHWPRIVP